MIKCENGTVEMQGTKVELMADVTVIMRGLMDKNILDKDDLEMSLTMALYSDEEIAERAKEIRETIALASLIFGNMEDK